jgi:hypothetical protein
MTLNMISRPITDIKLGEHRIYFTGFGDTWDPAWAEDDSLYSPGNDGSGWDKACSSNVFFNRMSGDDFLSLQGTTVNGMPEYGGWAQAGPDGCTWKSSGCISLDGTLYFGVARHAYGTKSGDPHQRQIAQRASIIMSSDHGLTWTRPAQDNYDHPMFPSQRFATPYFIHYGQDGKAPPIDQADRYVYAISNNGFWCNGDNYILGRVERSRISRLEASDWEFYTGGDGMRPESWSKQMNAAALIIANPLKCGETGATYIPAIGRYLLVAWYYPGNPNIETDETRFIFFEAPHPWGPWKEVKEIAICPEGWYCPRVLAKWQMERGSEIDLVLATGGDYYEFDSYYRFTTVQVTIKTDGKFPAPPPPPESQVIAHVEGGSGAGKFQYRGNWQVQPERAGSLLGSERLSDQQDASFTIQFEGRRVKWHTSKENNLGIAAVALDGGPETLVNLYTYCHVPQCNRLVYDSGWLESGFHTFTVRVTGQKDKKSAGVGISHDRIEVIK